MNTQHQKPNVIVFFTDQQRWDTSGLHGNPSDLTPNFDQMATEGTHFANTFTCQPVCGPARSCLQTGKYATETGVFRNGLALKPGERTLATCFNEADYRTGYIGKWHLAGLGGDFSLADEPVPEHLRGGYEDWLGVDLMESTSEAYETYLFDNDNRRVFLPGYRVDAVADAAIRRISEYRDSENPFLLFLSFIEPHYQNTSDDYPAPRGYRERYTGAWMPPDLASLGGSAHQHIAGYYGMVKRLDEALGRIRDALKSMDLEDDTIILFTSDHGCHFKTRNGEYKRSCHESSIRIPAAATGPGFDGGGKVQSMVSLLDFTPTLLDACRIPVPEEMQGHSIMPIVRRETDTVQDDILIQISESQVGRAVRTSRWKYSVRAVEMDGYVNSNAAEYTEEFLYDLKTDPYELNNLIGYESHAAVAAEMKRRLLDRMEKAGERRPRIIEVDREPYPCQMTVREREIFQ